MPRYLCPTIPSPSLEGNPLDSPNERELHIYLPPGYHEQTSRRYPVLYFLHGYGSGPPSVPPRRRLQEAVPRPLRGDPGDAGCPDRLRQPTSCPPLRSPESFAAVAAMSLVIGCLDLLHLRLVHP